MTTELEIGLYIFMLAGFLGYHVILRVPPLLHTPLMSATNAMSGISLVGSLIVAGADHGPLSTAFGFIAVACSSTNVVGGFLITDRMLRMFKRGPAPESASAGSLAATGAVKPSPRISYAPHNPLGTYPRRDRFSRDHLLLVKSARSACRDD